MYNTSGSHSFAKSMHNQLPSSAESFSESLPGVGLHACKHNRFIIAAISGLQRSNLPSIYSYTKKKFHLCFQIRLSEPLGRKPYFPDTFPVKGSLIKVPSFPTLEIKGAIQTSQHPVWDALMARSSSCRSEFIGHDIHYV